MKLKYIVYYTDGTDEMVEFEKPPGAHPTSIRAALAALVAAEKFGKTVDRLGTATVNPFSGPPNPSVIDEELMLRVDLIAKAKQCIVPAPPWLRELER